MTTIGSMDDVYRLIVEGTGDLVVVLAAGGDCVYANAPARRALALDEHRDPLGAIHRDDLEAIRRAFAQVLEGAERSVGCRVSSGPGRWRWLDLSATRFRYGGAPHILAIGRDVTERKHAELRQALHLTVSRVLADSTSMNDAGRRLLEGVCSHIGYDVGELWLVDDATGAIGCVEQWHAPGVVLDGFESLTRATTFHTGAGLPGRVWQTGEPIWMTEVAHRPDFIRAAAAAKAGLHTAVGCPIVHHDVLLGVLVFLSREVHEPNRDVLDLLVSVGNQTAQFVARLRLVSAIRGHLRQKETLIKEIHHRVKNNLQLVSSLLSLQTDQLEAIYPGIGRAFTQTQWRIRTLALVHDTLCHAADVTRVEMAPHVESICAQIYRSHAVDSGRVTLELAIADLRMDLDFALPCGLIINELLGNALKHAYPAGQHGRISIRLDVDGAHFELGFRDDGVGLPSAVDPLTTATTGLQLIRDLTEQLQATLAYGRDGGTWFAIGTRPRAEAAGP